MRLNGYYILLLGSDSQFMRIDIRWLAQLSIESKLIPNYTFFETSFDVKKLFIIRLLFYR